MNARMLGCLLVLVGCIGAASAARAADEAAEKRREQWRKRQEFLRIRGIQKLETMVSTGDPSKRVDIVVLSDGYERKGFRKYKAVSDRIAKTLVHLPPFESFRKYINFHRLYIESPAGEFVLGSIVDSAYILTCDRAKAEGMAQHAPDQDLLLVISNTRSRERSTASGDLITLCARGGFTRTTVHELGHAFAGLADEYVEEDEMERERPPIEPWECNVTLEPVPELSKWHYWVVPPAKGHSVTNREGAFLCRKGVYRRRRVA